MRRAVLAFAGDAETAGPVAALAERNGLTPLGIAPGLHVFAGSALSSQRLGDGSLIVGDLFSRSGATPEGPRDGWGNFLAFSVGSSGARISRAALTGMPFYWASIGGGMVGASDIALLEYLIGPWRIDWNFVAHTLAYINLRSERTGLMGVQELLPGTELDWAHGQASVASFWSPWAHVGAQAERPVPDLAAELERRVVRSVGAWSASRPNILLELSGGLDSSIVAAALHASSASFSAITFATPGADGDERIFARAVARHFDIELIEAAHDEGAIDLVAAPALLQARPGAYSVLGGIDRAFDDAIGEREVALFGGIGGDNVFEFDGTVAPINDAIDHFGYGARSLAVLRDIARSSGATIWEAMRLSRRARRAGPRPRWKMEPDYLNRTALPEHPFQHPWDENPSSVSQAKRNHVASIRRILDFLDRPGRWQGRDVVPPLLSQPVVELCLSVPSWTWFAGGRDRAVARAAFSRHLPAEIVWRRGKGRLETMCAAAYVRQRHELRGLLLDGRLADNHLVDRPAIEAYLKRDLVEGDFDYFRLIEIADVERWVRAAEASSSRGSSFDQR